MSRAARQALLQWVARHPARVAGLALTLALAPTLTLPFAGRDFYHLERAHQWSWRSAWLADSFRYDEYFWWPHGGDWCRYFRPLGNALTAAIARLGGDAPIAFRSVGLALMLVSVALFVRLAQRARLGAGAIVGATLWFALHPSRAVLVVEPVATAIIDGLVLAATLAALVAFAAERDGWRRGRLVAFVAVVAALLTKEIGVVAPAALVAWDACMPRRPDSWRALVRRHAPWLVLAAAYLTLWTLLVARGSQLRPPYYVIAASPHAALQWLERFVLHLGHVIIPAPFHPVADPELYWRHPAMLLALATATLAAIAGAAALAWRLPVTRFALALLLFGLAPVIPVLPQLQEQFLPSVGAALLLGAALDRLGARARALGAVIVSAQSLALAASVVVMAAACLETEAAWAAVRRALPAVAPGTRIYFISSGPATFMYASSAARLLYGDPTLRLVHLSFDGHDLPPNPRSTAGRALVAALGALSGASIGISRPLLQRRGERTLVLRSDGAPLFSSDLGRFLMMGRPPLVVGERLRWDELEVSVEDGDGDGPSALAFTFDGPLEDARRRLFVWRGSELEPLSLPSPVAINREAQP